MWDWVLLPLSAAQITSELHFCRLSFSVCFFTLQRKRRLQVHWPCVSFMWYACVEDDEQWKWCFVTENWRHPKNRKSESEKNMPQLTLIREQLAVWWLNANAETTCPLSITYESSLNWILTWIDSESIPNLPEKTTLNSMLHYIFYSFLFFTL